MEVVPCILTCFNECYEKPESVYVEGVVQIESMYFRAHATSARKGNMCI